MKSPMPPSAAESSLYPLISESHVARLKEAYKRIAKRQEHVREIQESVGRREAELNVWRSGVPEWLIKRHRYIGSEPTEDELKEYVENAERSVTIRLKDLEKALWELSRAITALDALEADVRRISKSRKGSAKEGQLKWPKRPAYARNPWPESFPLRPMSPPVQAREPGPEIEIDDTPLVLPQPTPHRLSIQLRGISVELDARHKDASLGFTSILYTLIEENRGSRWPAIDIAMRAGISCPTLDVYLDRTPNPWLPCAFVDEVFGLRGRPVRRDAISDRLVLISEEAAGTYLATPPKRFRWSFAHRFQENQYQLEELIWAGLVKWGPQMSLAELLVDVKLPEIKEFYERHGISPPRNKAEATLLLPSLVSRIGEGSVRDWLAAVVEPSDLFELIEIPGTCREERLAVRARANVLVSSLILLGEGDPGAMRLFSSLNSSQPVDGG